MTYEHKLKRLYEWKAHYDKQEAATQVLRDFVGIDPESVLYQALWDIKPYTSALSELLEDHYGWLDWYMLENDMGNSKLEAGSKMQEMRPVSNLEDLLWLIERSN
jgi:hypothetical protein